MVGRGEGSLSSMSKAGAVEKVRKERGVLLDFALNDGVLEYFSFLNALSILVMMILTLVTFKRSRSSVVFIATAMRSF